ncbi:major facilitator superfamily domain-containing protein [Halenospora varia]|nr:major facilitator superfamily domain-containing protein [Halenospora varia]
MTTHEVEPVDEKRSQESHGPANTINEILARETIGESIPSELAPELMDEATASDRFLHGWRLGIVITSLTLGIFLIALDTTIIGVAIPRITSDFHDLNDISWFGSAYLLTVTAFQPSFGTLYKFFNAKWIYLIAILTFEVGSILCAAAPNPVVFILGRAIAGLGAAGIYQGALNLVGYTVVLEERPMYFGIVVSAFAVSACIGPILGGALTDHATWRWCFWINVPIGACVLAVVICFLNDGVANQNNAKSPFKTKLKYFDGIGTVTFIGSICCLLLGLQWGGQTYPWKSSKIIGLFIGFGLLFGLFTFVQWKRGEYATIPLRIIRQRSVAMVVCLLFFSGISLITFTYYIPIYFQSVRGLSATASGIRFIALIIPQMFSLIVAGIVATKWGYYAPYIMTGTVVCTIGCGLITTIGVGTRTTIWATYEAIIGIGLGASLQLPYTALQLVLSENDLPTGNAVAVFASQLGSALALSISQTLLLTNLQTNIPRLVPSVSPAAVISAGAANLRLLASDEKTLDAIRGAWAVAVRSVFILALAASAISVPFSFFLEHLNVHVVARERKQAGAQIEGEQSTE